MSQTEQQTFIKHILPDISKSIENYTPKLGQLLEHNMIIIFLKKSCTKYGGETSHRPFFKK